MLYQIDLDQQLHEEVNVIIRLPGPAGNDLRLSFHLDGGHTPPTASLPVTSANPICLLDCQEQLVCILKHLTASGYATLAGKYRKSTNRIPLFRGDTADGLYVDSVDKKTGQNLLKGIHLKNPDKLNKLTQWVVTKFPVVSEWAGVAYTTSPHSEERLAYIISMAERRISNRQALRLFQHG
ncbi:MAG: hypothetical protein R3E93_07070 [Thiothrix sp.]